jgi:hypothetical protein
MSKREPTMKHLLKTIALLAAALPGGSVLADGRNPTSLLLFPEFNHTPGHNTLITVTNTNRDAATGNIRLHYHYISGVDASLCTDSDRFENLTAGDTLTVLSSAHAFGPAQGYLYVVAVNAAGLPIAFNWLIGDVVQLDGNLALQHSVVPVPFDAVGVQGSLTDVDHDGIHDLNGLEYEKAPDRILIPRFMEQGGVYSSELVFVALTGGLQFTTLLDFLIYNDNEELYSSQYAFRCWKKVALTDISAVFTHDFLFNFTNHSPQEILGSNSITTGWMSINGDIAYSQSAQFADPAFVAYLYERTGEAGDSYGAEVPFMVGKQANGDLLPVSTDGDTN